MSDNSSSSSPSRVPPRFKDLERLIKEKEDEILNKPVSIEEADKVLTLVEGEVENCEGVEPTAGDLPPADEEEDFELDSSYGDAASLESEEEDPVTENDDLDEKISELKAEGDRCVHKGDWAEAVTQYSAALQLRPLAALYGNRSFCYNKMDKFISAEKDCDRALELDHNYKRVYRRRAALRLRRRDYYGFAKDLQSVVILSPGAAGTVSEVQEEYKAVLPLARYLSLHPDSQSSDQFKQLERDTLAKLSRIEETAAKGYESNLKWAQVVECLTMASIVSPLSSRLHVDRAVAYLKQKKFKLAEEDCTKAIELEPTNGAIYKLRAAVRKELNDLSGQEADEAESSKLGCSDGPGLTAFVPAESQPPSKRSRLGSDTKAPPLPLRRIPVLDIYSSGIEELFNITSGFAVR